LGSIQLTPSITEIEYVPENIRLVVGDIILTAAIIQEQLARLFAVIVEVNPAVFVYLGHTLDTSQMIKALKRLIKSDDAPIPTSKTLSDTLTRCAKALEKRNMIAHYPIIYVDNMLMRSEIRGGKKPHRVAQVLNIIYFQSLLLDMKSTVWELRCELGALQRRNPSS
jgi:hypothetical protein